jgi:hypothetical protein
MEVAYLICGNEDRVDDVQRAGAQTSGCHSKVFETFPQHSHYRPTSASIFCANAIRN